MLRQLQLSLLTGQGLCYLLPGPFPAITASSCPWCCCFRCFVVQRFFGTAVGKGRQAARNEIEKLKLSDMTAREAVVEAVKM